MPQSASGHWLLCSLNSIINIQTLWYVAEYCMINSFLPPPEKSSNYFLSGHTELVEISLQTPCKEIASVQSLQKV